MGVEAVLMSFRLIKTCPIVMQKLEWNGFIVLLKNPNVCGNGIYREHQIYLAGNQIKTIKLKLTNLLLP